MTRTRPKGSGRWHVKRPAKPPGLMFPSMRDAIMLWWSWGGCDMFVGTSGCQGPVLWVVIQHGLRGEPEAPQLGWAVSGQNDTPLPGAHHGCASPGSPPPR
jgi:hypothetical protein